MEVDPDALAAGARAWDEQHLDLRAAGDQVMATSAAGFTPAVSGAAGRFTAAWARHLDDLALASEALADGLRETLADLLRTDLAAAADHVQLAGYLEEIR